MARIISVGPPANESERKAIRFLRENLPNVYTVLHNFEIPDGRQFFEVDLCVVGPEAVFLVDVKGTNGVITVDGPKWCPDGRESFHSPVRKINANAKALKSMLERGSGGARFWKDLYVEGLVILTGSRARLDDPHARDKDFVVGLKESPGFFAGYRRQLLGPAPDISRLHAMVVEAIRGSAVVPRGPARFGGWLVTEDLKGGTPFFREYLACDADCRDAGTVRLRVYRADPYLPEDQRLAQAAEIATAYQALGRIPAHECLVNERDFFGSEEGDCYVLVLDDVPGTTLGTLLGAGEAGMSVQQKISIARDILAGLRHVHEHGVVHRNLAPSAVIVDKGGRARISDFDFARVGSPVRPRLGERRLTPVEKECLAPEVRANLAAASPAADVYAAGGIISRLLAGGFPACPALMPPKIWSPLKAWLRRLTARDPAQRPTAAAARDELEEICALR